MISNKSTSTRQQCKWICYFYCFKWYLDSNNLSRRIHKWCLDQLISDILQVVLMKIVNIQEMVLLLNQSYTWYHISTRSINNTRRWFHKWSSTLSDHQSEECIPHQQVVHKLNIHQVNGPCLDIGGGAPLQLVSRSQDPTHGV